MSLRYYGADSTAAWPSDVVEDSSPTFKHIELRLDLDAVAAGRVDKTKVLEALNVLQQHVAQDTWPPPTPAQPKNRLIIDVTASGSGNGIAFTYPVVIGVDNLTNFPGDELPGTITLAYREGSGARWQPLKQYTTTALEFVTFPGAGQAMLLIELNPIDSNYRVPVSPISIGNVKFSS